MKIEIRDKQLQEKFKKISEAISKDIGFKPNYIQVFTYLIKLYETAEKG